MLCACRVSDCSRRPESKSGPSTNGQFFFTPDSCNEIVQTLTRCHPESVVDVVARAEALAGNGATGATDPSTSFVLARAYRYTQAARFLDRLASLVEDGGDPEVAPYDQEVVRRAAETFSDLHAIHLVGDAAHAAPGALVGRIQAACSFLARTRKTAGPLAKVMAAGSVAMAALCLRGLRSSEKRREWALSELSERVGQYAYPGRPVSLGERCLVAEVYLSLIVLSERLGIEVPSHVLGGIETVVDSIEEAPDLPLSGGPDGIVLNVAPFEAADSREAILALGTLLFDRPDFRANEVAPAETLLWLTGIEGLEEYATIGRNGP